MVPKLLPPSTDALSSKIVKEEVEAEVIEVFGLNVSVGVSVAGGTKMLDVSLLGKDIKQFPGVNI